MTAKAEILLPAFILLGVGTMLGLGVFVYDYSATVLRFPLLSGILVCVLCILRLAQAAATAWRARTAAPPSPAGTARRWPQAARALWILAVIPATYLFGYLIGLPLYVLAYMRAHGESWATAAGGAALCLAVVYGVFMKFLAVPVPVHPWGWPW